MDIVLIYLSRECHQCMPSLSLLLQQQEQQLPLDLFIPKQSRLRRMDFIVLRSIVGRARHELEEFNHGYSRSDKLRRRRLARYQLLSRISISAHSRINCDKCQQPIEFQALFFIQKRKSYNKYYHHSCASSLNMCY